MWVRVNRKTRGTGRGENKGIGIGKGDVGAVWVDCCPIRGKMIKKGGRKGNGKRSVEKGNDWGEVVGTKLPPLKGCFSWIEG